MDWFSKAFLKSSLAWLTIGVTLGAAMAIAPSLAIYRLAHVHMNLIGFVGMMIAGVAYHVVPRFTGHPLHSRRLAGAHWWLANVGLAIFVAGFALRPLGFRSSPLLLGIGGSLSALGMYLFAYNLWRTIDTPGLRLPIMARESSAVVPAPPSRVLATLQPR
ncbi:MAG: hypothetical protein M3081_02390 [Gemmatimonadota bacterium]|nr:hypothetical protein [Gemmatimonadota bacterium]